MQAFERHAVFTACSVHDLNIIFILNLLHIQLLGFFKRQA
jgi:hypothetical protein